MKILSATFETSAPDLRSCPSPTHPEIAFIGRSNVGKSSLINLITRQRQLAKVSGTPGKTRLINFFAINRQWFLVDLPGYGYAKVRQADRYLFNQAVADYLEGRPSLACVFVLIDSRVPPQEIDLQFIDWLAGTEVPFELVFTKTDKQSASQTAARVADFNRALKAAQIDPPPHSLTSATTGKGRGELLARIARFANP